ncbi:MAG: hypothetical protein V7670_13475 [Maribacter arcticus]|uniref:hypothetical protein n=1 Tax=Maribacter arcticus TaxID=561365 RepID=UPI003002AC92
MKKLIILFVGILVLASFAKESDVVEETAVTTTVSGIFSKGSVEADNTKVYVCHNGNVISVNANAVSAHVAHGDVLGCSIGVCPINGQCP